MKTATRPRKVTPKPTAETTVGLADLTITWRRRKRYAGEPKDGADLTITGTQLAAVLGTLAEEEPQGKWDTIRDPDDTASDLESLNEVLYGLSYCEDLEASEALAWLTRYVRGLVAQLRGHEAREEILASARVTIACAAMQS